ncbi:MAG TPA: hypothetical protein VHB98_17890, partial [Chloroflexota bacterium]|nr:hypothetical protein [Chloroflexota bacterium]
IMSLGATGLPTNDLGPMTRDFAQVNGGLERAPVLQYMCHNPTEDTNDREFAQLVRESLDQLKAVTAGE